MLNFIKKNLKRFKYSFISSPIEETNTRKLSGEDKEIEILMLKYEKLQFIEEKERERDDIIEKKASMFIGSTSIMGAVIIGCSNLVTDSSGTFSYVNMCILSLMVILIYNLGRSITYSVLTLRKRNYWTLGVEDLQQDNLNKEEYYKKLIDSTIRIIKHNQHIINRKVDSMQIAQESFIDFWVWSGIFLVNLLAYHIFHAYDICFSWSTLPMVFVTLVLSIIGYLIVGYMVKKENGDNFFDQSVDNNIEDV